ncbi:HD-GYP domain-containing protein [Actinocorallia sp. API 0066]|uniref:HD-GYP domain-containing protein n=1 Tax=Actinocorallia sp. API 0066 TaxID=2896846 RepID=UPI001E472E09|nr:HD-GYP domain-containing protein [Actinocorallia sp. API 0066]MCD0448148.1 HD-GYP domain-containing protein [Actinocorallia sp. API 0066]
MPVAGLPLAAWTYVGGVVALAATLVATASYADVDWAPLAAMAVLFLACDSVPALLSLERARVSLSFSASLASVVLLGPVGAGLVGACALFTWQRVALVKRVYNGAQFALCGFVAGFVYDVLRPEALDVSRVDRQILPFAVALLVYVMCNLALVGGILLLSKAASPCELRDETIQLTPGLLGYGSFGLLIAGTFEAIGAFAPVLVMLPLLVARWAFAQTLAQQRAHEATLATLCQAVETKDYYTRGHSERVSRGSVMIAEEIGMSRARVEAIRFAGMLHDVGKLGVPTKVLQKEGPLTEEEFAAIQLHPMRGLEIIREIGFLDEALTGIMYHHEKLNGRGYPQGLAGDEIPEFARIIGVADAFDAMTSTRSYRPARSVAEGVAELRRCSGEDFDPQMVDAFLRALDKDSWPAPDTAEPPAKAQTSRQDHDDPAAPIRVSGEGAW